jgi:hypothetical protein
MLDKRLLLWIGKLAFPKVNTKKTSLMLTSSNTYAFRVHDGSIVELRRWVYKSMRHHISIVLGYHEATDVLLIREAPLIKETNGIPVYTWKEI